MDDPIVMEEVKRERRTEARLRAMDINEIVDEIHQLESRIFLLSTVLEDLDEWHDHHAADAPEWQEDDDVKIHVSIGFLRRMRAALTPHAL